MRFSKLSLLFRRSKSDSFLARVPTKKSKPFSMSEQGSPPLGSAQLPGELPSILGSISVEPISIFSPSTHDPPVHGSAPMQPQQCSDALAGLRKRIQELEVALQTRSGEKSQLESLLLAERNALEVSLQENELLKIDIARLQSDIMHTRGELYTALNQHLQLEPDTNVALLRENDRLRKFTALIISCGAHNSILNRVSQHLGKGHDPEEAMVDAIKDALKDPESVWRRLLNPILGSRSPEDYLAQTNCTLKARREGYNWQKRALFWKGAAREDGRHASTVTPSVSQLSATVNEMPHGRRVVVEAMLGKLREGTLPLAVGPRLVPSPDERDVGGPTACQLPPSQSHPSTSSRLHKPDMITTTQPALEAEPTLLSGTVLSGDPAPSVEGYSLASCSVPSTAEPSGLIPFSSTSQGSSQHSFGTSELDQLPGLLADTSADPSPPETAEDLASVASIALKAEALLLQEGALQQEFDSYPHVREIVEAQEPSPPCDPEQLSAGCVDEAPLKGECVMLSYASDITQASPTSGHLVVTPSPRARRSKLPVLKWASFSRTAQKIAVPRPVVIGSAATTTLAAQTLGSEPLSEGRWVGENPTRKHRHSYGTKIRLRTMTSNKSGGLAGLGGC